MQIKNSFSKNSMDVSPTPFLTLSKPYYLEYFINTLSEVIKFYSSPHRAFTYSHEWTEDDIGENRTHLIATTKDFWNYNSPKIGIKEFETFVEDKETYQEYARYVLRMNPDKIIMPNLEDSKNLNDLYIKFINQLENDWLFYRSHYKLFRDVAERNTVLFIELAAYSASRHFRFLMRKAFGYLEGNYVTSLRREGIVYIPHLQFSNESVELLYTSAHSLELEHVIADYFIKEDIKSVDDLLTRFETIIKVKVDVAKEEKANIFLNPSEYINRDVYIEMFRQWIHSLKKLNIDFQDRNSIVENINIQELEIPENIFITDRYIREDKYNYPSDKKLFYEKKFRTKRILIRNLFADLLQYSINRYRFEERRSPLSIAERSEYEDIFCAYKNMTLLEQDVGCLLVECGEISFIIMLWRYIENHEVINDIEKLFYWGLIEKNINGYTFSSRAKRMAKWCMKLLGLKYRRNEYRIDYSNKPKIKQNYENLVKDGGIFSWMTKIKDSTKISRLLGEMIFPAKSNFTEDEIVTHFKELLRQFYDLQLDDTKNQIHESIIHSRFQKNINEFNRAKETINRTAIAFPISTIPTKVETKIRTFSIFIGSFNLGDQLDNDNDEIFEDGRRELIDMLHYAKVFYTLVGKPASESVSEAVIRNHVRRQIELTLGRYQHKVKNEGVYHAAKMDKLWRKIEKDNKYSGIRIDILEMKKGIERYSGTIQVLNIATNGFQRKYLEDNPYCIIDVIAEAYCNAFQQFYMVGKKEEVEQLWSNKTQSYLVPLIDIEINFDEYGKLFTSSKKMYYIPAIEDMKLHTPSTDFTIFTKFFDAYDILDDQTILDKFSDVLPKKIIMQSPFFEIFTNTFLYMSKTLDNFVIKTIVTRKFNETDNKLIIEVINPLKKEMLINKELTEIVESSAGLAANKLFFENIGGGFIFKFDEMKRQAIARAIINFQEMESVMKFRERSNGFTKYI